jgi:hypothetical protein
VQFEVASIALNLAQTMLLAVYLMITLLAKIVLSVTLFPTTASVIGTTVLAAWLCFQDTEPNSEIAEDS